MTFAYFSSARSENIVFRQADQHKNLIAAKYVMSLQTH